MKRKGGSGKLKDNWVYSITIDGSAFENKENGTLELFEEFLSTTITSMEGKSISRRVGNNSKKGNSNSNSNSNSNNYSNNNINSDNNSDSNSVTPRPVDGPTSSPSAS